VASAVASAVACLLLAGCGGQGASGSTEPVSDVRTFDEDGIAGVVLPQPYALPPVTLQDTAGKPYDLAARADTPLTLVFFGYTHCPDICQTVMADIASAVTRLDDARKKEVDMVFVTTDPARDDAATLRRYLDRFNPGFEGLTGDLAGIERLAGSVDILVEKGHKLASGGYDVGHGTSIIGLEPDGTAPYVWTEGTDAATLAADVTTILDGGVTKP
jgi:protein SCO1/2